MPDVQAMGPSLGVSNIVIPQEGPRVLQVNLDFTNSGTLDVQGLLSQTTGRISYIQGAYVDNQDNANPITFLIKTTQQRITIPARAQGYVPMLFATVPDCLVSTVQAAVIVPVHFYNVPIQAQWWLSDDAAPTGTGGLTDVQLRATPVPVSGPLTDDELRATPLLVPIGGAWTDRSNANLSGASQSLMEANANRRYLLIQNISVNDIGINLAGGVAAIGTAGTITINAGGSLEIWNYPPTSAITIIGTVNADVTAFEG